jgi:hypothetical protein
MSKYGQAVGAGKSQKQDKNYDDDRHYKQGSDRLFSSLVDGHYTLLSQCFNVHLLRSTHHSARDMPV